MKKLLLSLPLLALFAAGFFGCSQSREWNKEQRQAMREALRDYRQMVYLDDLTDAEFEQKYELPENSWFTPAVRYVIENNIMLPAGHIDGKEYFPWFNPAENRCTVAEAIYNSAKLVDPKLTASYAGMAVKEAPDYAEIPELYRDGASFCFESGIMTGDSQHYLRPYDSVSRQEFAAVLQRYITLLQKAGKITVSYSEF